MNCYFCNHELKEERLRPPKRGADEETICTVYCNRCPIRVQHHFVREYESLSTVIFPVQLKDKHYNIVLNIPFHSFMVSENWYYGDGVRGGEASILDMNHIPNINPTNAQEKLKLLLLFT